MIALVTGGAGFIGSHLVKELVRRKYKVIVLDNLSTGSLENLKSVKNKIKFIKFDLSKNKKISKYLKGVDYVFHLAGLISVEDSLKHPNKYYLNNVIGTTNLLNSLINFKIKKLIYAASASCYGNSKEIPTSEKANINLTSPYARTKWIAEQIVMKFNDKFPTISLRLFNVYGPNDKNSNQYSGVINIFLNQKKMKKPFTIFGDGCQTRSFIYVLDVVDAMLKTAQSKLSGEIFNVSGARSVKINEIAKLLKGKKIYISKKHKETRHSSANIKKIRKKLNWKPLISIKAGINILLKSVNK